MGRWPWKKRFWKAVLKITVRLAGGERNRRRGEGVDHRQGQPPCEHQPPGPWGQTVGDKQIHGVGILAGAKGGVASPWKRKPLPRCVPRAGCPADKATLTPVSGFPPTQTADETKMGILKMRGKYREWKPRPKTKQTTEYARNGEILC